MQSVVTLALSADLQMKEYVKDVQAVSTFIYHCMKLLSSAINSKLVISGENCGVENTHIYK